MHHYAGRRNDEISFNEDDVLILLDGIPQGDDWLRAEFDGKKGLVPANYLEPMTPFQVKAEALYDYKNHNDEELNFSAGDIILVDSAQAYVSDWWTGTINNKTGIFPAQYVKIAERFQGSFSFLFSLSFFFSIASRLYGSDNHRAWKSALLPLITRQIRSSCHALDFRHFI